MRLPARRRLIAVALAALSVAAIHLDYRAHVARVTLELQEVSERQAAHAGEWLAERLAQGHFVHGSVLWAHLFQRFGEGADAAAGETLLSRLVDLRKSFGDLSVMVLDARGDVALAEPGQTGAKRPELRSATLEALAQGVVRYAGPYQTADDPESIWLDVIAPLAGAGLPAQGAVVVRLDASKGLLRSLQPWPGPSRTATTQFVRRWGEDLLLAPGSGSKAAGLLHWPRKR